MATDGQVAVPVWNIANIITMIRIAMVPVFVWLYLEGGTTMQLVAAVVFLLAALTDKLDGYLARSRGLITNLGKLLDPIADKALVIAALVLLSLADLVPWWVTALILVRELGITLLRMAMVRRSVMAASAGGKLKTVLQMAFLVALLIPWHGLLDIETANLVVLIGHVIMYLALAVTLVTGLMYVGDATRIAREAP